MSNYVCIKFYEIVNNELSNNKNIVTKNGSVYVWV